MCPQCPTVGHHIQLSNADSILIRRDMLCRNIQRHLAQIHVFCDACRCGNAVGFQDILNQHGSKVMGRHLIFLQVTGSIYKYLVDAVGIDIIHRHIFKICSYNLGTAFSIQCHSGRCRNIVNGQIWILLQLSIVVGRAGEVLTMQLRLSLGVGHLDLFHCFKQSRTTGDAICLKTGCYR